MENDRFDALTRTFASRRSALGGLLGGLAAVLGFTQPEEADAHNFLPRCRKIKDAPRRRACVRRARAHNRTHRSIPPPCVPQCSGGKACVSGACACPPGQEDSGGVCAVRPNCLSLRPDTDCQSNSECCSDVCSDAGGIAPGVCLRGAAGRPCNVSNDCKSLSCVGFVCQCSGSGGECSNTPDCCSGFCNGGACQG